MIDFKIKTLNIIGHRSNEKTKKFEKIVRNLLTISLKQLMENTTSKTKIIFVPKNIRLGCHISKNNSIYSSILKMLDTPLSAFQIFLSSPQSLAPLVINKKMIDDFLKTKEFLFMYQKYLCVHGSLLINLCGAVDENDIERKTETMLKRTISELDLASVIGIGVVIHTGSHKNKEKGINLIIRNIKIALTEVTENTQKIAEFLGLTVEDVIKNRKIILENAAGEGSKIGKNLDEISKIIKGIDKPLQKQIKVCIDTAHIFGAGEYNFGNESDTTKFYNEFEEKIGLNFLELFHLNDSRVPFGSKKDRHENLSKGFIFSQKESGLKFFVEQAIERNKVLIGEPPGKTAEGGEAPGFRSDYELLSNLCPINNISYQ